MAATGGAAGKENDADDEAAVGAQPTKRNSKDLPRGVVQVKKEYQARASWKRIGARKAEQRHIVIGARKAERPRVSQCLRLRTTALVTNGHMAAFLDAGLPCLPVLPESCLPLPI